MSILGLFDARKNFGSSLVATAPSPATSGTSLVVTAGQGTDFPAASFWAVICPAGSQPTNANAEVVRVTAKSTDTFTITRAQQTSSARTVVVGDQIFVPGWTMQDFLDLLATMDNRINDFRLTLTTGTPVTRSDVTAATTLYWSPYVGNRVALYTGSQWIIDTSAEISIAVPASTNQMYDAFVYDNAGVPTLELAAWTNDTTRATALVRQDGVLCKTGALTRRYVGSFRTTGSSGQTEDSFAKRFVWNMYNRVARPMRVTESTDTWNYTLATIRQANASAANQLAFVIGWDEVEVSATVQARARNGSDVAVTVGIGEDSTTAFTSGFIGGRTELYGTSNKYVPVVAQLRRYPAVGYHYWAWLEASTAAGTTNWAGDDGTPTTVQSGIEGSLAA